MASTYLTRTFVTPTSNQKFTASFWIKGTLNSGILLQHGNDYFHLNSNSIDFEPSIGRLRTNRLLRDVSAWYNVIIAVDTTLGTADDRFKLYINGVQETSFASRTNPSQNATFSGFNTAVVHKIGQRQASPGNDLNFDGSMSYVAFIDGKQELPTIFGETDATTGEWKIKTSITPTSGWGNNGFLILKDGNSVTDQSGEGHNWTVGGGTLTSTTDCPDNNFATWNILYRSFSAGYASAPQNANLYVNSATSNYDFSVASTLAFPGSGKFYWEYKIAAVGTVSAVGISEIDQFSSNNNAAAANYFWNQSQGYAYKNNGDKLNNNSTASYGNTYTTNDIIQVAYKQWCNMVWKKWHLAK